MDRRKGHQSAWWVPLEGVEAYAFDVAEDEEFTECAETKANGSYEIIGLDEGPYRVEFKSGERGPKVATQYHRNAATPQAATIVRVNEGQADTGINAQLELDADGDGYGDQTRDDCPQSAAFHAACPTVSFAPGYQITPDAIQVEVSSSAKTPIAVSAPLPGPSPATLTAKKTVTPGKPSTFSLPISAELASQLAQLDSSDSLPLTLHAHATKVKGKVSSDRLAVRLPGRG